MWFGRWNRSGAADTHRADSPCSMRCWAGSVGRQPPAAADTCGAGRDSCSTGRGGRRAAWVEAASDRGMGNSCTRSWAASTGTAGSGRRRRVAPAAARPSPSSPTLLSPGTKGKVFYYKIEVKTFLKEFRNREK